MTSVDECAQCGVDSAKGQVWSGCYKLYPDIKELGSVAKGEGCRRRLVSIGVQLSTDPAITPTRARRQRAMGEEKDN